MIEGLVGDWKVVACQLHGRWLPYSIFKEFIYTVKDDDTFNIEWSELSYPDFIGGFPKSSTGKVEVGGSMPGNHINFVPDTGPFQGKKIEGIFDLDHGILKAIFTFPDGRRPEIFDSKQGQVYEVWQKITY